MTNPYRATKKRDAFKRVLELLRLNPNRSNRMLAQVVHIEAGISILSANQMVRRARQIAGE